jgi:DNA-binding MarR family transcriptional regulator
MARRKATEKDRKAAQPPARAVATRDARAGDLSAEVKAALDQFRLGDIVSHLLRRAHFAAEEEFSRTFASEKITPRQKAALIVIYQEPGLNQNALSALLFMDRNTVAELVARHTARKLIARRPAAEDRRAYQLYLAPAGAALLDRVLPRDLMLERRLIERLPREHRAAFVECLRILAGQD